jgi:microcystin-dependent protein
MVYLNAAPSVAMTASSVAPTGNSQAHENRPPLLGVYCNIALFGVYPSRN